MISFNDIWGKHQAHLRHFLRTKIDRDEVVEDLLQEVAIKLHDNLKRGTEILNHKAWLFQTTRYTIADYYRKINRNQILEGELLGANLEDDPCICDLSGFIIQTYLPEQYSRALYLSDIEKQPQQIIAQTLGLSLSATKSRIQRGRKYLKDLIEDCIEVTYNERGEIFDFELKPTCELPIALKQEMDRINLLI